MPIVSAPTASTEPRIRAAIAQAANSTGVDFGFLYNQARLESSLDPQAKARTSSAAGLFQFTKQTWLQVVKAHGAEHGAGWAANAIEQSGSTLNVADAQQRTAIDKLRYDPEFASAMAAEFASDNRVRLETGLGRSAQPADLYLAHFLGGSGAVNFLAAEDADPGAAAAPLFPAAAAANRSVFYGPGGEPRSLSEIHANFAAKLDGVASSAPPTPVSSTKTQRSVAEASERPPMQMASIEPIPQRLSLDFAARAYQRLAGLGS